MTPEKGLERAATGPVMVPGVVSLAASSRRTLKHGDSFAMFDESGDIVEVEHSPAGLFHFDTRFLSRLLFTLEGHRPLVLSSTVQLMMTLASRKPRTAPNTSKKNCGAMLLLSHKATGPPLLLPT